MHPASRAPALGCSAILAASTLAFATAANADHIGLPGGAGMAGPIITIPADTLPAGTLAGALHVTYAKPKGLSDGELAARAGRHVHAHRTDDLFSPSATLAYGVTDAFTLSASLPYLRRDDLREGTHHHSGGVAVNGVEALGSPAGLGDLTLLGQYRVAGDEHTPWRVALLGGLKTPTGATHERSPDGERLETEHQPGTGSWDPLLGLAVSRRVGPVSVDGNVLRQFSGRGAQSTTLGDRTQVNLGLSYRLGAEDEHHDAPGGEPHHHDEAGGGAVDLVLELNGEWEGRQKVDGVAEAESGGRVLYLSPGLRWTAPQGWAASLSLSVPVTQHIRLSHPRNAYRLGMGLARTF